MFVKNQFIKPDTVERREYQISIAESASKKNTLVVLPTGLGKTLIALFLIAKELEKKDSKILFLAPTKPLVFQHAHFLNDLLTIEDQSIIVFTGEVSPSNRKELWKKAKIIVSTPQVVQNDLLSKKFDLKDISLMIFDEAHHAVGDYAYVFLSEIYRKQREKCLILGITASPGNDLSKILEVCKNLDITNIEIRTKFDHDVKPYVHDLKIVWKEIQLPQEFSYTIQLLRKALSSRLKKLKEIGAIDSASLSLVNKTKLLEAQKKIQSAIRASPKPHKAFFQSAQIQSEAMKIHYALELIQTQGVNSLRNYFQRMRKEASIKRSTKSSRSIISDQNILEAIAHIKTINIEHPKVDEVINIVKTQLIRNKDSKIIVFTHYRDTSANIYNELEKIQNVKPARFIGQTMKEGDKGLSQKEQAIIIKKFKEDEYNVLIATSVAEEGLDIPSCDLVVFYEPIPSEIRAIQRRGRTARKMAGKVIILITKGTPDEGYYWSAKRKEKRMKSELELIRNKLTKRFEDDFSIYDQELSCKSNQKTLIDFEKKKNNIKVVVDNREYRSNVVKHLTIKGIDIEPHQLDVGDYILSTRIGVERKNVDDFLDSLINGKLFKQISQLRNSYSRPILILEGENLLTKRNISHNAIFGSISSISVDFGIPVLMTKDEMETADLLKVIATREQKKDNKVVAVRGGKPQMSLKERQQYLIEGLPNVSAVLAKRLLTYFGSVRGISNASEKELMQVAGVGKGIATEIIKVLNSDYFE